jgi:archaetidylinositol phosphate synthase
MSSQAVVRNGNAAFVSTRRTNHSLTAAAEKRLLQWMAARAPQWVTSDGLTALGLAAQLGAGACYGLAQWDHLWLLGACVCIALNWLGDSLDGTLARVRRRQRPRYGFYVDHAVDIFGSAAMMGGMALSGLVHAPVALGMLIAFLLLSAESYLATHTLGCFEMSQGLFGPTEIRILLIIGNLALLRSPYSHLFGNTWLLFDIGGVISTAGMLGMALITAARHTRELYRLEPVGLEPLGQERLP